MNLELTEKEVNLIEWTVNAFKEGLEHEQRNEKDYYIWDLLEEKCKICIDLLKKIKNGKESNQRTN